MRRGFIKGAEGLNGDFRFVYLPMLADTADDLESRVSGCEDVKDAVKLLAEALAERIVAWNIDNTPINGEMVGSLQRRIFERVREIVTQRGRTDIDPLWNSENDQETPEQQIKN